MNERIRELVEQARRKPTGNTWVYRTYGEFEQEFARLIVRECINEVEGLQVSQSTLDWSQHWNRAIAHTALHLKEHFEVD